MATQTKTNQTKPDTRRHTAKPSTTTAHVDDLTPFAILSEANGRTADESAIDAQAARLGHAGVQRVQRQTLAAHIGHTQGNRHLQRVVASLKKPARKTHKNGAGTTRAGGTHTTGPEPTAEETEQEPLDSGSRAAIIPAAPPPPQENTNAPQVIQRQPEDGEPTEAEKAQALAAAEAARAAAAQARSTAKQDVAASKQQKAGEVDAKQAAKQKKETAKAEAKGKPKPGGAEREAPGGKKGAQQEKAPSGPGGPETAGPSAVAAPDGQAEVAPASPDEDPGFQAVVAKVKRVAAGQQAHAPAKTKAGEAQAAAVPPAGEVESKAQAGQVGEMEQAKAPAFDAAGFKAQLMERIEAMSPKTAEEADSFKERDQLGGLKGEMQDKVDEEKQSSTGPLEEKTAEAPDTAGIEPKPVSPLPPAKPGAAPGSVGAEAAVPKQKGQSEVEAPMQANSTALDEQMAETEVPEETLLTSNEPDMIAAAEAKRDAQAHADTAPAEYRAFEGDQLAQAQADAASSADARVQAMHGDRAQVLNQVEGQQRTTKSEDEKKREKVAGEINRIYEETKTNVETILSEMDQKVETTFDAGATAAKQAFEDYLDTTTEAWKQDRYGGWLGWAKWVKDKFTMHPRINEIAGEAKRLFIRKMDAVIDNVVAIISRGIEDAKAEIARGRKEVQTYVAQLPADLQQVGQQAAAEVAGKFDELQRNVDSKQDELIETLANKYQENLQAVNSKIEEYKSANQGLYDKAKEAIAGVIQTLKQLKNMLMNVLSRAAAAIKGIIKDPIGFLGNLVTGIKQGLQRFVDNIGTHLKQGLIGWLTGAIADAGITLPTTFDLKGIFMLVMQILGLTFDNIRAKIVTLLGFDPFAIYDQIMGIIGIYQEEGLAGLARRGLARVLGEERLNALMKVVGIFEIIQSGNLGQIWEMVQEHLTDLKEMVFGKIEEFIAEKVIKAGILWVMSLLNPAGAFVRACKMIYDIVMFFVERGSQIKQLVTAIIGSISAIVSGNVGGMASAVENALARAIPVAISFLASLLGLGGVSKKVKEIIESVRGMVDRALDAVFNSGPVQMVAGFIRKVVDKVKGLAGAGVEKVKGFAKAGVDKAKGMAKAGVGKVKNLGKRGAVGPEKRKPGMVGPDERTEAEKKADVERAVNRATTLMDEDGASPKSVRKALPKIQSQYKLTSLTLEEDSDSNYHIEGMLNPESEGPSKKLGPSDAEIAAAVGEATANRNRAIDHLQNLSDEEERESKTVACAGSQFFKSGWGSETKKEEMRPEALLATQTTLFETGKWKEEKIKESGSSIEEHLEEFERTGKKPKVAGLEYDIRGSGGSDKGVTGKYVASHAERQAAQWKPNQPIGVSRAVCGDCQKFFKALAQKRGTMQVVADPNVAWIFYPDGHVEQR